MNAIIISISIGLVLLLIWIFTGNKSRIDDTSLTNNLSPPAIVNDSPPPTPQKEEVWVSYPRQFRRAQQALFRERNELLANMKAMAHQGQVLDIQSGLVSLETQQVALQNVMVSLQQKDIEITSKHNEIELFAREQLLDINEAKNQLETQTIDSYKLKAENDIKSGLLEIEASKLDLSKLEADVDYKQQALDLNSKALTVQGMSIDLSAQEIGVQQKHLENIRGKIRNDLEKIELGRLNNQLSYQDQVNLLNEKELELKNLKLDNVKGSLENMGNALSIQKKDISLDIREGLHKQEHKSLENKKGEIRNLLGHLDNKATGIRLSQRELKISFNELSEQFRVLLNSIRIESRDLKLDRKANRLSNHEEFLGLYEQKVNNLSAYNDQMYRIKSEWLRIESKGNDLQYREYRIKLDKKHDTIERDINRLRQYRVENNLMHREQKLEVEQLVASLEKQWRW